MIYLDLPNIHTGGTVEEQLSEIRSYIYKNNEQINAALANLTTEKLWENTANAVSAAESRDEAPQLLSQYAKIRNLIVKTAGEVTKTDERYHMLLSGSYLAKSQFGEYLLKTSVEVDGNSTGFTQLYNYAGQIDSAFAKYRNEESMYIKQGLLDDASGDPVYGIELGILEKKVVVDEVEHTFNTAYRTRIEPDKWSFLYNDSSGADQTVAYMQQDKIYFPKADITGGSININNNFIVNSLGEMTANAGTFSGTLAASSLVSAFESWSNKKIKLDSQSIVFLDSNENDFVLSPGGMTFYKRDTVDKIMSVIERKKYNSSTNWGLNIRLKENFASFLSVEDEGKIAGGSIAFAYIPHGSIYRPDNMFGNHPGLHIDTEVFFHDNSYINDAKVHSMDITGTLKSDGEIGATGKIILVTATRNGDGSYTTMYADLFIHNGIITGLSGLQPF